MIRRNRDGDAVMGPDSNDPELCNLFWSLPFPNAATYSERMSIRWWRLHAMARQRAFEKIINRRRNK